MSKPISFGFGKSKTNSPANSQPSTPKPISLPLTRPQTTSRARPVQRTLHDESDDEGESVPKHELVTGFSTSGAILSKPKEEKQERIIINSGNGDWRRRGRKNLLPSEVQAHNEAQRNGSSVVTVEKDEVSTATGLQYASTTTTNGSAVESDSSNGQTMQIPEKEMTEDERALAALLDDGTGKPKSNAIIATQGNTRVQQQDEIIDFRDDVATRPDSATLEEYAAMPVEEFGMAMLRGMGQKRKANGEVIDLNGKKEDDKTKKLRKQEGFLGIGAKPAPGIQGVELGAWGKADMRKNQRGEGFFTPVMLEDKRTGERITEEELERRKREAKDGKKQSSDEWRDRRDRNLERNGRESEVNGSRKRHRDHGDSRSDRDRERGRDHDSQSDRRRDSNRDDRDYDSRSKRDSERSRSREHRRRDRHEDDKRDRYRDKDRARYRDDDSRHSSSSRRSHGNEDRDERYRDRR